MSDTVSQISKEELKRIAIVGTHLHQWQGHGDDGIRKVIREQAAIQLDPLNPAGRSHDLFLASRVPDYRAGRLETLAYPERLVFEAYGMVAGWGVLMAISAEHFPVFYARMTRESIFRWDRPKLDKLEQEYPGIMDQVLGFIRENGPTRAVDLAHLGTADPKFALWKSSRISGTCLDFLWQLGEVTVVERDASFRKCFDLTERFIDKRYLYKPDLMNDEARRKILAILLQGYPIVLLGKLSRLKRGGLSFGKKKRASPAWFEQRPDGFDPCLVQAEGDDRAFAVPGNWERLLEGEYDDEMRALSPLDPLIWDRDVMTLLFDFDYVWEVYKRKEDRVWGYYVYPLLYQGQLIGRMEATFDRKKNILEFFKLRLEEDYQLDDSAEGAMIRMLRRWGAMVGAEQLDTDESFPPLD
jgi:uncharacterized protein YcaQ